MSERDLAEPEAMAASLQAELFRRNAMLATAESITGGEVGTLLTAAPGASDTYLGGVVSYASEVKQAVLNVSVETIERHGVVSGECASEMAQGVRSLMSADYAVSTTGVAGPASQEGKPVGLVFVAVAGPDGVKVEELRLSGERAEIRRSAVLEAVAAALEFIARDGTESE